MGGVVVVVKLALSKGIKWFTYIVQNMFLYVNMILTGKKDKFEGKNKREGVQGGADCQSQYYQKGLKIWII